MAASNDRPPFSFKPREAEDSKPSQEGRQGGSPAAPSGPFSGQRGAGSSGSAAGSTGAAVERLSAALRSPRPGDASGAPAARPGAATGSPSPAGSARPAFTPRPAADRGAATPSFRPSAGTGAASGSTAGPAAGAPSPFSRTTGTAAGTGRMPSQPAFRPAPLLKGGADGEKGSPFRSSTGALRPQVGGVLRTSPTQAFRPGAGRPQPPQDETAFRKDLHISDSEFIQIRDFIYKQCGIFIAENRKYLVENRLSNRIKELGLKTYTEYYNFLRFDGGRGDELNKLFEVVTTNETSFFRNPPQLKVFQDVVLAEIIEACRRNGKKRIRIWSAGCSTGEEPYTLAIILKESLKSDIGSWDIKITANDLSEAVLAAARRGIYNEYALRTTPPEIIRTHFVKEGMTYKIDPSLKKMISFGQINLNNREQLRRVEKSQIVFCRNVIIYFDDDMKRRVIGAFYDNLEPNGMLLIGHSESLHNISRAFRPERHTGTIVYRKLE